MALRIARRGSVTFLLSVIAIVIILLHRSRFLLGLLFENGSRDAIYPSSILSSTSEIKQDQPQLIPKIIHQTYRTEEIPEHWKEGQEALKELHSDWEYMFWTDNTSYTFIQKHYPSFVPIYNSYPHPIQRADAIRYFLLYHYGGIYLDLDLVPYRTLDPLLQFPAFACLTAPTGISNDFLGSAPFHPFLQLVIENLEIYNRNFRLPYLTIMYSTGPLFFSVCWVMYLWKGGTERVRLLVSVGKEGDSYGFFRNVQGGSWHGRDTEVVFWMGRHWVLVTVWGFVGGFAVVGGIWWVVGRFWGEGRKRGEKDRGRARYRDV